MISTLSTVSISTYLHISTVSISTYLHSPRASDLIVHYDEHVVVNNYKFGAIYQRYGQVTEEALFGNRWGKIFTDFKNIS